jgi:mono/diheme cytochrome c family protein
MRSLAKRMAITLVIFAIPLVLGLLFTYQIIHIDWISFMEIQPSFLPMEDPLPLPPDSVPIQGAAFVPGTGSASNPIPSDQTSLTHGQEMYQIHCALCHGDQGKGDGPIAEELVRNPADLTNINATQLSDGELFQVITDGVRPGEGLKGGMPDLRENLSVNDRWDVVNYVRSLQGQ